MEIEISYFSTRIFRRRKFSGERKFLKMNIFDGLFLNDQLGEKIYNNFRKRGFFNVSKKCGCLGRKHYYVWKQNHNDFIYDVIVTGGINIMVGRKKSDSVLLQANR